VALVSIGITVGSANAADATTADLTGDWKPFGFLWTAALIAEALTGTVRHITHRRIVRITGRGTFQGTLVGVGEEIIATDRFRSGDIALAILAEVEPDVAIGEQRNLVERDLLRCLAVLEAIIDVRLVRISVGGANPLFKFVAVEAAFPVPQQLGGLAFHHAGAAVVLLRSQVDTANRFTLICTIWASNRVKTLANARDVGPIIAPTNLERALVAVGNTIGSAEWVEV
jgi:hypothetical protein